MGDHWAEGPFRDCGMSLMVELMPWGCFPSAYTDALPRPQENHFIHRQTFNTGWVLIFRELVFIASLLSAVLMIVLWLLFHGLL